MGKRGFAMSTIVVALVVITVGLVLMAIFLGPKGLLNSAANKTGDLAQYIPVLNQPVDRIEVEQPQRS